MHITSKILRDFPDVHRWEQTADVYQNASLRLYKALADVKLNDARHFYRLAAMQIRRELIDLARHYRGPQGMGAHHQTLPKQSDNKSNAQPIADRGERTLDPSTLGRMDGFSRSDQQTSRARTRSVRSHLVSRNVANRKRPKSSRLTNAPSVVAASERRLQLHELLAGEMPELE